MTLVTINGILNFQGKCNQVIKPVALLFIRGRPQETDTPGNNIMRNYFSFTSFDYKNDIRVCFPFSDIKTR